jgi:copper binding plastocyanin/azurin family protein
VVDGRKSTFTNTGSQPHNAAGSDAGGWDTGMLSGNEARSVTFNKPGTYSYICTPHPFMIGQIIVTGPEVASAPAVVVESVGRKADESTAMPSHKAH